SWWHFYYVYPPREGYSESVETSGLVSGVFQSTSLGPSVGGMIVEFIGIRWAASIIACLHIITVSY
ncbi:unnamed protein product, partial [Soboliphyme baturini]|uniref:MFS domain-containing protein n=1 Tax=Soboliphyme baturini TaxID=241478 RepID=A0A183J4U5_9BILA